MTHATWHICSWWVFLPLSLIIACCFIKWNIIYNHLRTHGRRYAICLILFWSQKTPLCVSEPQNSFTLSCFVPSFHDNSRQLSPQILKLTLVQDLIFDVSWISLTDTTFWDRCRGIVQWYTYTMYNSRWMTQNLLY